MRQGRLGHTLHSLLVHIIWFLWFWSCGYYIGHCCFIVSLYGYSVSYVAALVTYGIRSGTRRQHGVTTVTTLCPLLVTRGHIVVSLWIRFHSHFLLTRTSAEIRKSESFSPFGPVCKRQNPWNIRKSWPFSAEETTQELKLLSFRLCKCRGSTFRQFESEQLLLFFPVLLRKIYLASEARSTSHIQTDFVRDNLMSRTAPQILRQSFLIELGTYRENFWRPWEYSESSENFNCEICIFLYRSSLTSCPQPPTTPSWCVRSTVSSGLRSITRWNMPYGVQPCEQSEPS